MYKALVIAASLAEADDFRRHLVAGRYPDVSFIYPSNITGHVAALSDLYKDCCGVLEEENVDMVIPASPDLALVQSALVREFPRLGGCSVEAAFLCLHRLYNKQQISVGFTPEYGVLDVEEMTPQIITDILEDTGFPAVLCDTYYTTKSFRQRITNSKTIWRDLHAIKQSLKRTQDYYSPFLRMVLLDTSKYNLAFSRTCILEEFCNPQRHPLTVHWVEGCVAEKRFVPWAITDFIYWKDRPRCVKGFGVPTSMSDMTQMQTWAVIREVTQNLIGVGFDYQFFHAKVTTNRDQEVKIYDFGIGNRKELINIHRHVFQGGDSLQAILDMNMDRAIQPPKPLPRRYAMRAHLTMFSSGLVDDVFDVNAARKTANVAVVVAEGAELPEAGDEGCHLATIDVTSDTGEGCTCTVKEAYKELMFDKTGFPWLTQK